MIDITEFTKIEVDHDGFGGLQDDAITTKTLKLVIHLLDTHEFFYDLEQIHMSLGPIE